VFDWQTVLAFLAIVIAGLGLFDRLIGKSLSRGEHEEFKERATREADDHRTRIERLESHQMDKRP